MILEFLTPSIGPKTFWPEGVKKFLKIFLWKFRFLPKNQFELHLFWNFEWITIVQLQRANWEKNFGPYRHQKFSDPTTSKFSYREIPMEKFWKFCFLPKRCFKHVFRPRSPSLTFEVLSGDKIWAQTQILSSISGQVDFWPWSRFHREIPMKTDFDGKCPKEVFDMVFVKVLKSFHGLAFKALSGAII